VKVVICGDRHWADRPMIEERMRALPRGTVVITGGASGADSIAAEIAREIGFPSVVIEAEWSKYGRGAGPKRNRQMLACEPDLVIAFHRNLAASRGTKNCVQQARGLGIQVEVIPWQ
jgi:hypothetical protein